MSHGAVSSLELGWLCFAVDDLLHVVDQATHSVGWCNSVRLASLLLA